jgi:hypothetical protein
MCGLLCLCTGQTANKKKQAKESVIKVYLLNSEYLINEESQEIHLLTSGTLPEVGEVFSVPFTQQDTGVAFTVNTCGVNTFILNNTLNIVLTITTYCDARHNAFLLNTHLSERGTHCAQKSHKHFNRERKSCFSGIKLQRRTILRL